MKPAAGAGRNASASTTRLCTRLPPLRSGPARLSSAPSKAFLDLFLQRSNGKVLGVNAKKQVEVWTANLHELVGVSEAKAMGGQVKSVLSNQSFLQSVHDALQGWETLNQLVRARTGRLLLINTLPRLDERLRASGATCLVWDVTRMDREQLHALQRDYACHFEHEAAALASEVARLKSTLETKQMFVRSTGHEIRTPLNIALGGLQLLSNVHLEGAAAPLALLVEQIRVSMQDAVDVVDDFLTYEKLDGNEIVIEKTPLSAVALVRSCLAPLEMHASAKGVSLLFVDETPRDLVVFADRFKMRQVMRNLMFNAVKFSASGSEVLCRLRWCATSWDARLTCVAGFVRMEVIDHGPGLTVEEKGRLFKSVVQFHAAAQQGGGGSGMGLYIAQRLVALNGGCIDVVSDGPGTGCTFFVELPVSALDLRPGSGDATSRLTERVASASLVCAGDGKLLHLLLVDDSALSRKIVSNLLAPHFASVTGAEDGAVAVAMYAAAAEAGKPFDLVLMDADMPVMSGMQASRELRKLGFAGPIIGLTGHEALSVHKDFASCGADYVITKPVIEIEFVHLAAGELRACVRPCATYTNPARLFALCKCRATASTNLP